MTEQVRELITARLRMRPLGPRRRPGSNALRSELLGNRTRNRGRSGGLASAPSQEAAGSRTNSGISRSVFFW